MSEEIEAPEVEGAEAEVGPEGVGETTEAGQPAEPAEPTYDFLPDEYADKHVTIKVDGEEIVVPLTEALQGYSRTQDYTRKTQALATQRQEAEQALLIAEALQRNPGMTIQVLAQQAGVSVEEFIGLTPNQQQQALTTEVEYDDPLEKALAEERQARQALEDRLNRQEADQRLGQAVQGLKQQYNATDDQVRAVVNRALQMGLGLASLPMVYQAMAFEAQQKLTVEQQASQEAEQQRRAQAAAQAQQRVATEPSAAGSGERQPAQTYSSIRDAIAAAIDEVEGR